MSIRASCNFIGRLEAAGSNRHGTTACDKEHSDTMVTNPPLNNLLTGSLNKIALPAAITDGTHPPLTLYFDNNSKDNLWLAVTRGK